MIRACAFGSGAYQLVARETPGSSNAAHWSSDTCTRLLNTSALSPAVTACRTRRARPGYVVGSPPDELDHPNAHRGGLVDEPLSLFGCHRAVAAQRTGVRVTVNAPEIDRLYAMNLPMLPHRSGPSHASA